MSSLHFARYEEGNGISADIPNGDSAILTSDARATLWRGLALLRSGDSMAADTVHEVVWASAIDRFPTGEGGGVVCLSHSVFCLSAILAGGGVVCVDAQGPGAGRGFLFVQGGVFESYILRSTVCFMDSR